MRRDLVAAESVWAKTQLPELPVLESSLSTEVCVVGAGIAGLSVAYFLSALERRVVVLESGASAGRGETGRTTAHLANALDDRYFKLEQLRGAEVARRAAESHTAAIAKIESIVNSEGIECDFQRLDGYLFLPPGRSTRTLKRELEAAHRAGLGDVELVVRAPSEAFDTGPCLRFPRQGQFHPMKYLGGLIQAIRRNGSRVFSGAHVASVEGGKPVRIRTDTGMVITAECAVIATNSPITDVVAVHTKQFPYRTYALAATIPPGAVAPALYWDTMDPYHYIRMYGDNLVIIGGEDHKTGHETNPESRFRRLARWARRKMPIDQIQYRWSGQIYETLDGLAYIGPDPSGLANVYIATGDSGMGMTHGTIAGMLITDLIRGVENPWRDVYDPARKPLAAVTEFAKENVDVAAQYTDWIRGGDVSSVQDIKLGEGAILRDGASKVAVYRRDDGEVHAVSAACTHLGCVVQWNSVEKGWDCPCHGSRFDRFGKVLNGPASRDLAPFDLRKTA